MSEVTVNRWMRPDRTEPYAHLVDGTPLYPAYHPVRRGEGFRRQMGFWTGQCGERVGVTIDGQLYRQDKYWGSEGPDPARWDMFQVSQ